MKLKYTSALDRAKRQSAGTQVPYLKLPQGATVFRPKPGVMLIDILPYVAGVGNPWAEKGCLHWERTFYVHRGVGPGSDSFLCPRLTSKKPCPICEHRARLMKQGADDEQTEQLIADLAPKQRQLFNVINLRDPNRTVQLWDMSYHLFGRVLDARLRNADEEDGWERFFFLEGGLTLKVGFVEKQFAGYAYCEAETIDFRPRTEDYDEEILKQVFPLDSLLIEPSYDELKKAFLQVSDDDEAEKPAPPKGPATRPRSEEVDDEEEADEEEPDEADEEEPPRVRAAAEVVKKARAEEADEEEDEWDWDEEEKPQKPAKPALQKPGKQEKKVEEEADEEEDEWDWDEEKSAKSPPSKKPLKRSREEEE